MSGAYGSSIAVIMRAARAKAGVSGAAYAYSQFIQFATYSLVIFFAGQEARRGWGWVGGGGGEGVLVTKPRPPGALPVTPHFLPIQHKSPTLQTNPQKPLQKTPKNPKTPKTTQRRQTQIAHRGADFDACIKAFMAVMLGAMGLAQAQMDFPNVSGGGGGGLGGGGGREGEWGEGGGGKRRCALRASPPPASPETAAPFD